MARGRVTIDDQDLRRRLDVLATLDLSPAIEASIDLIEAKSVELAPIDTGNLEQSFVRDVRSTDADFGFQASYAAQVHELPEHARGPRTREKPGNEFGPAGPRYLLRAMTGLSGRIADVVGTVIERLLARALGRTT